ncbi:MAG TPA: hypothetical protein VJK09_01975 [Candidatus Paceibacterota bacterium]
MTNEELTKGLNELTNKLTDLNTERERIEAEIKAIVAQKAVLDELATVRSRATTEARRFVARVTELGPCATKYIEELMAINANVEGAIKVRALQAAKAGQTTPTSASQPAEPTQGVSTTPDGEKPLGHVSALVQMG